MTDTNDRPVCDNASVGVLIINSVGQYLMFDRLTEPVGVAPVAGHVWDAHDGYEAAARAEVQEELGLTVTNLLYVTGGWRNNKCRRAPGPDGVGHEWQVYRADVEGEIRPAVAEVGNVRWLDRAEINGLAARTIAYACGGLTDAEFAARPGIEPVWVRWLEHIGIIPALPREHLRLVNHIANTGSVYR